MRTVQFAQHFAQQILEIVVVVDGRQETAISFAVSVPIDAVNVFFIELVLHLLPSMVENVLTLKGRFIIEDSFEWNRFSLSVFNGYLFDTSTSAHIEVFALLVDQHRAITYILQNKFGAVFF